MKFYAMIVEKKWQFRKAEKIEAKDFTSAKRVATRKSPFFNPVIYLGLSVDDNGFIIHPVFIKENGKWDCMD